MPNLQGVAILLSIRLRFHVRRRSRALALDLCDFLTERPEFFENERERARIRLLALDLPLLFRFALLLCEVTQPPMRAQSAFAPRTLRQRKDTAFAPLGSATS